jgi:uncharacterized damage-inducible protein DinB
MAALAPLLARFERLEASRLALLEALGRLEDGELRRPSPSGGWSIVQLVGHVRMAEEHSLSYVRKKMQDPASIPKAGLDSLGRLLVLAFFLRTPLRFKAPERVASPPADTPLAEARAAWDAVRGGWRSLLETFPPELIGHAVYKHPYVGRMKLVHCLGFMSEHFRHHRKQIDRLRSQRTARSS